MKGERKMKNLEEEGTSNGCKEENNKNPNAPLSSLLSTEDRDFLLSPTGAQVKVSHLEGTTLALYFAANWQPQCQAFTNLLIQIYNHLTSSSSDAATAAAAANAVFEVVFVSSDEDSSAFSAFQSSMPWLSLPFSDLPTRRSLSQRFHIEAIPSLVILCPNGGGGGNGGGHGVVLDGVELIHRYGVEAFPFTRERIEELERRELLRYETQTLVNLLTNHDRYYLLAHPYNSKVPVSSLVGKTVGLYFSAQWCVPCTRFTPKLISIYHKIKQTLRNTQNTPAGEEDFEIIFVSSDRDEQSFNSYFNSMPFFALPNGDATIKSLVKHFDVRDIPCLVILGPDGKTVTKQGRILLNLYGERAYPFTRSRIESLEREIDEAARSLPTTVRHVGHTRHRLSLVSEGAGGGPFICCVCDEQGSGWAYLCIECGYEVHPRCVRAVHGDGSEVLDGSTVTI